ncbi:MAG: hypothetical protein IJR99_03680, partial [Kiritimatiellae bacterium]|nr:hypothetical protein [Kiritimatiellia bacterium]
MTWNDNRKIGLFALTISAVAVWSVRVSFSPLDFLLDMSAAWGYGFYAAFRVCCFLARGTLSLCLGVLCYRLALRHPSGGRKNGSLLGWIRANGCPLLVFALVFLVRETVSFRVCNLPVAYSAEGGGGSFPDESPCVLDTGQIDGRAPFETVAFMDGDSHQALLEFSGADIASVSAGSGEMGRYYKVCLAPKAGEDFRKMTKKQLYRVVEI